MNVLPSKTLSIDCALQRIALFLVGLHIGAFEYLHTTPCPCVISDSLPLKPTTFQDILQLGVHLKFTLAVFVVIEGHSDDRAMHVFEDVFKGGIEEGLEMLWVSVYGCEVINVDTELLVGLLLDHSIYIESKEGFARGRGCHEMWVITR